MGGSLPHRRGRPRGPFKVLSLKRGASAAHTSALGVRLHIHRQPFPAAQLSASKGPSATPGPPGRAPAIPTLAAGAVPATRSASAMRVMPSAGRHVRSSQLHLQHLGSRGHSGSIFVAVGAASSSRSHGRLRATGYPTALACWSVGSRPAPARSELAERGQLLSPQNQPWLRASQIAWWCLQWPGVSMRRSGLHGQLNHRLSLLASGAVSWHSTSFRTHSCAPSPPRHRRRARSTKAP